MRARDLASAAELAADLALAETPAARIKGLLGHKVLPEGSGLWLTPCNCVHSFGMKFPIDVLFLDGALRVVGLVEHLAPNRVSRVYCRARSAMELPAGTLSRSGTGVGNRIEVTGPGRPLPKGEPASEAASPLRQSLLWYALLLLAHLTLIWVLPYFPSQDGPSHLYNLVILNDLLHGGGVWGRFYEYQLRLTPNLGFHLAAYPLLQFLPPQATERSFLSLYLLVLAGAVPYLLRSFQGRAFPLSFVVFPLVFNFTLLMGFYSYCLAAVLFQAALGCTWQTRQRPGWQRLFICTGMGAVLYLSHLTAGALFAGAVVLLPVAEGEGKSLAARIAKGFGLALPLFLLLGHYLAQAQHGSLPAPGKLFSLARLGRLLGDFFLFSTVSFSRLQLFPLCLLLGILLVLAKLRMSRWRAGERLAPPERYLLVLAGAIFFVYLAAPNGFAGGSFFNERLPWVILALVLPVLAAVPQASSPGWRRLLIAQACLFFLVNTHVLWTQGRGVERFVSSLAVPLPQGSCVALYRSGQPEQLPVDPLLHALGYPCLNGRYVDIGNYETQLDYFPVRFSRKLPPLPGPDAVAYWPRAIPWGDYPAIGYLYGVNTNGTDRRLLSDHFQIVREKGPYSLWQRIPLTAEELRRVPRPLTRGTGPTDASQLASRPPQREH